MPITYVLKASVPPDQSIQQYKETLEKRLTTLKPKRLNKFHLQTCVFQAPNQTTVHQFLHSDYSSTCFNIVEPSSSSTTGSTNNSGSGTNSSKEEIKVVTGDIGMSSIQRRICELGILTERKAMNVECTGSGFRIGDFQIKLGAVTHNSSNRGLLIEISYSSASNNQDAFGVICEFVQSLFGWANTSDMLASLVRRKQKNAGFTPEDTIIQYYEHFSSFRSSSSSSNTGGSSNITGGSNTGSSGSGMLTAGQPMSTGAS